MVLDASFLCTKDIFDAPQVVVIVTPSLKNKKILYVQWTMCIWLVAMCAFLLRGTAVYTYLYSYACSIQHLPTLHHSAAGTAIY